MVTHNFPQEILLEIFYKLPVKSLGKCMCVSKAWNSLIKSPSFVSSHLNNNLSTDSSANNNLFLVLTFPTAFNGRRFRLDCSLHLDDRELSEYTQLQSYPSDCDIVGSCNGLLCLWNKVKSSFIFYNPIIRRCIRVPNSRTFSFPYTNLYGFGFDSIRNDYKVLIIICIFNEFIEAELYSLSNNSWKILAPPKYKLFSKDFMVFVNGVVYCIAIETVNDNEHSTSRRKALLLGFDMSNDVFEEIVLPESLSNRSCWFEMYLVPYNELSSIAVIESVSFSEFNIWVMQKDVMVETWTKMFKFETKGSFLRPWVLGFRKNGDLIFRGNNNPPVVVHDLESNKINNFGIQGINGNVIFSYMESLVLLNQDAGDDIDLVDKSTGDASSANDSSTDNSCNGQSSFSYELLE